MISKTKKIFKVHDKMFDMSHRKVMGIINMTPDSFYKGNRYNDERDVLRRVAEMISAGVDILDIGGMSSRPGAETISGSEELARVLPSIKAVRKEFPELIISIDTYRSEVLRPLIDEGIGMINDISGGGLDPTFLDTVAESGLPYILMHMHGTPRTMQDKPVYQDVLLEVITWFSNRMYTLKVMGIHDIIVDPGFGFGKTVVDNYKLLKGLEAFDILEAPVMVGVSRKRMIYETLETDADSALYGTIAAQTLALKGGASILRAHDVKAAAEAIRIYNAFEDDAY